MAYELTFGAKDFDALRFGVHAFGGDHALATYPNGYGVSVVRFNGSYGWPELYELAVIEVNGDGWRLTYDTPIADDVIGFLTPEGVSEIMEKVAALPGRAEVEAPGKMEAQGV